VRITEILNSGLFLSPSERQIADYIIEYPDRFVKMSIPEASTQLFVSKSTIIRFAKKLGYKGYKQLCQAIIREQSTIVHYDIDVENSFYQPDDSNIRDLIYDNLITYKEILNSYFEIINTAQLKRIAGMISRRRRIVLWGISAGQLTAINYQMELMNLGIDVIMPMLPDVFAKGKTDELIWDLVMIICPPGCMNEQIQYCIRNLYSSGAYVILLASENYDEDQVLANEIINVIPENTASEIENKAFRTTSGFLLHILCQLMALMERNR